MSFPPLEIQKTPLSKRRLISAIKREGSSPFIEIWQVHLLIQAILKILIRGSTSTPRRRVLSTRKR
jgi:hypothetical protein